MRRGALDAVVLRGDPLSVERRWKTSCQLAIVHPDHLRADDPLCRLHRGSRDDHPIFNASHFALASRDRFFLCIEAKDPLFDLERTAKFLEGLGATVVSEVEE